VGRSSCIYERGRKPLYIFVTKAGYRQFKVSTLSADIKHIIMFTCLKKTTPAWLKKGLYKNERGDCMFSLIDELPELIYVADTDTYDLLYLNRAARKALGLEKRSYIKCYEAIQGRRTPCEFCTNQYLKDDSFYVWRFTNPVLNRHYLLKDKLIEWGGRKARLEIAFDITEEEQEKIKLGNTLEAAKLVNECAQQLYTSKDMKADVNAVLQKLGEFLEAQRAFIFENANGVISNIYEWSLDGLISHSMILDSIPASLIDRWMERFSRSECIMIEDTQGLRESRPEEYQVLSEQGVRSLMVVPIVSNDEIAGLIGVANYSVHKLENTRVILNFIGYFIGATFRNFYATMLLEQMSYCDSLTQVGNRNAFNKRIAELDGESKCAVGVVYIDVNGMKPLNDRFGHQKGDETLIDVARSIRAFYGSDDIYRIGGDEFVVICENVKEDEFNWHVEELKSFFALENDYSVSVGTFWTEACENIHDVLFKADEQMYADKRRFYHGRFLSGRYRHDMDDVLDMAKPGVLKRMINERRFHVFFQPKIGVDSQSVIGAEALVRCETAQGQMMPPSVFIPVLEEAHLIGLLDFHILDVVCSHVQSWLEKDLEVQPVSVNFSRYTLSKKNFVRKLCGIWEKYRIPKTLVEIEITETKEEEDFEGFLRVIRAVKKEGFSVSVDDFGVKNANLYLFTAADFDTLKIDKNLVDDLSGNPKTRAVISAVSDICHKMNIKLIVEGVETEEQLEILKKLHCTGVQGFLFSKPVPADVFEERYIQKCQ